MALLVEDSYRLLRDIPDAELVDAFEAAQKESGNFPPSAGLVARCWEHRQTPALPSLSAPDTATGTLELMAKHDAWWASLSPQEQEEELDWRQRVFEEARLKLAGGNG